MKFLGLIMTVFFAGSAWAQDSDKLDIKKLEEKYWSAKDDEYSVVQNRAFTKANRYYVFAAAGTPLNDAYSAGQVYTTNIGYYFSEKWGAEVSYMTASLINNDATDQFVREHRTVPNHNRLNSAVNANFMFVPLYAKMSFLDKKIIYFDMGVSVGFGQTTYSIVKEAGDKTSTGVNWNLKLFQHFFFTENIALRADFINMWTDEEKERYRVQGTNTDPKLGTSTINDTSLLLGVTYWF